MKNYSNLTNCPITFDNNSINYFSLGEIPLVNNLCSTLEESLSVDKYPLNLIYFNDSGLTCLDCIVNPETLFKNYLFKTSVNLPYLEHCEEMYSSLKKFTTKKGLNFCDIGGNDGSLLEVFKKLSDNESDYYLNIDPSENLTKICKEKGIETICEFFSSEVAMKIEKKFDFVISTNVFQHLKEIDSFVSGVKHIIDTNGVWVLEFPYWVHDMRTNQFDQIYHEHIYYYSIKPLNMLFDKHGMKILNIVSQKIHGGTLRVYISKKESIHLCDDSVKNFLDFEKKYDLNYHLEWGDKIHKYIQDSKDFLLNLKSDGSKIFGFGAAAKGCVYLNAMNVGNDLIDVIIDDTDLKQEKFVPGVGIQVKSREFLKENKPDYILILAHNFSNFIMESLKSLYDGKYILLIPEIKIINPEDN